MTAPVEFVTSIQAVDVSLSGTLDPEQTKVHREPDSKFGSSHAKLPWLSLCALGLGGASQSENEF